MSNILSKLIGEKKEWKALEARAQARHVTGTDVAAFCDARLREHDAASYIDDWRASLNADVAGTLAE